MSRFFRDSQVPDLQKFLTKYIFCQVDNKNLTISSIENGRKNIIETSKLFKYDLTND